MRALGDQIIQENNIPRRKLLEGSKRGGFILKSPRLGSFCSSFAEKGSMTEILSRIPISVIFNEDAPVLGAAHRALAVAGAVNNNDVL